MLTIPDSVCFKQADVCIVIDSSGSICGKNKVGTSCKNWSLLLSFVNNIIEAFDIGEYQTRVSLVTFSNDASLTFGMNQFYNRENLKRTISLITHIGGPTNTGKALYITRSQCFNRNNGERRGIPNITIVITDGLPTVVEFDAYEEATSLKQVSTVIAVGITKNVESQFLRDISSSPQRENENYFVTPNFSGLSNIVNALVTETCQTPLKTTISPISGIILRDTSSIRFINLFQFL